MGDYQIPTDDIQVWTYLPPTIIAVGTIGNMLSIAAVTNRRCKKSSFTVYLAALAISDTLVLYTFALNTWLRYVFEKDIARSGTAMCKLYYFAVFLFPHMSSWLIVLLTVERTFATYFSQKYKLISGAKTGCITVAVLFMVLFALNSHLIYGHVSYPDENITLCDFIDYDYADFFIFYWAWIDFAVYCFLPVCIIILANTATVLRVFKVTRSTSASLSESARKRNRYLLLVTLMVSISFVLLTSPWAIHIAFAPFLLEDLHNLTPTQLRLETAFYTLLFTNHAVNFFLYVLSGPRFREDLKAVFTTCAQDLRCCRVVTVNSNRKSSIKSQNIGEN